MINLDLILESPDDVKRNNDLRGFDVDVDETRELILMVRKLISVVDDLRAEGNAIAKQISGLSDSARDEMILKGKAIKVEVKAKEEALKEASEKLDENVRKFPNILQPEVHQGGGEDDNEVDHVVGDLPEFDFEIKDHMELGLALGIFDVERAAKVSGSRFVYLKGDGVRLEFALLNYAFSVLSKHGFDPVLPPHLISTDAMDAMGYLQHGGDDEIYHLKNDDLVLIGTSEQAIGPMYMNEFLDSGDLPIRMSGFSPCYRREAGSYGKDVSGILRMHQFDKIEMFVFSDPEDSREEHERLLGIQEELMKGLALPYRVVRLCSGDMGMSSSRTLDIETWMPGQNRYRETHSTSNTTDFQTRRLGTRIKREGGNVFAHALNGTAFAVGRVLIAILENGQQADGRVLIPEVLVPFMDGRKYLEPKK